MVLIKCGLYLKESVRSYRRDKWGFKHLLRIYDILALGLTLVLQKVTVPVLWVPHTHRRAKSIISRAYIMQRWMQRWNRAVKTGI